MIPTVRTTTVLILVKQPINQSQIIVQLAPAIGSDLRLKNPVCLLCLETPFRNTLGGFQTLGEQQRGLKGEQVCAVCELQPGTSVEKKKKKEEKFLKWCDSKRKTPGRVSRALIVGDKAAYWTTGLDRAGDRSTQGE